MSRTIRIAALLSLIAALGLTQSTGLAAEDAEDNETEAKPVTVAEGKMTFTAPKNWVKKQPRVRIIEAELATPAAKGDETDGRLTIMRAGGGVEANIDRWIGQFSQADGKSTKDRTKISKEKIAGLDVHRVDISGTFSDRRGPFAPAVQREDYRMLGAIIVSDDLGQYFIKYYGPKKTIAENEKAFDAFLQSLQVKN